MPGDFAFVFAAVKTALARHARHLQVKADSETEYTLVTKTPSPFPQHKGQPMYFGSVRRGRAYVSFHLMPLYMTPQLLNAVSPGLKKRKQGKTCFNFKTVPDGGVVSELSSLAAAGLKLWRERKWA